jgi:hypothetical protein
MRSFIFEFYIITYIGNLMNMQRIEKEWFIISNLIMLEKFINFRVYLIFCDLYD